MIDKIYRSPSPCILSIPSIVSTILMMLKMIFYYELIVKLSENEKNGFFFYYEDAGLELDELRLRKDINYMHNKKLFYQRVLYKICEKNPQTNRFLEKETCLGVFAEDKQLEDVFTQWYSQCDDRRRVVTETFIYAYDISSKKKMD
ncbi:hypothetical protein RhiirA4_519018 [Rhizophagus irregularis]|uniref:Uncharacterized protein n=1 Tax=Rhizophagus irregularis TaxID=588596 RepID=A0A2I1HNU8_9GLOM|nr:hypothetical protein RhiirA4_519018 [Rhizophagus irregularis]